MGNPTSASPGAGYTWIDTGGGEDPSHSTGYWLAPTDPNAQANYQAGAAAANWTLPKAPGASYFEAGSGNPWVTPGLQRSMNEFFSTPTSGYGAYMAPHGADYGAQLPRWQFSNSAPVPQTAPVGWGRYPGVGGAPAQAPWVTNPNTFTPPKSAPAGAPPPYQLGSNYSLPTAPGTPPQTGGGSPYTPSATGTPSTEGWMPGPATAQVSPSSLSGFTFANAKPGSVQDNFNKLQARYGADDAINYLIREGYTKGHGEAQSPWSQFLGSLRAGGMGDQDISRITNQFSAGGSGGVFNNSLGGFNGGTFSNGLDMQGLLGTVGAQAQVGDPGAYLAQLRAQSMTGSGRRR